MGCCSILTGGVCEGGLHLLKPHSYNSRKFKFSYESQVFYYDPQNKSLHGKYYHFAPYADRGYYKVYAKAENEIESCSPKPKDDSDLKRNAGACLGGQTYEYCKEVSKHNKMECFKEYQMGNVWNKNMKMPLQTLDIAHHVSMDTTRRMNTVSNVREGILFDYVRNYCSGRSSPIGDRICVF